MASAGYIGQAYFIASGTPDKTITITFNRTIVVAEIWVKNFSATGVITYDNGAFASGTGTVNTPSIPVAGSGELVWAVTSNAADTNGATGAWADSEGGGASSNASAFILSVSANTAVGWAGTAAAAFNAIGMSFAATAGGRTTKNTRNPTLRVGDGVNRSVMSMAA